MGNHDQRFKSLLRHFLPEFFELFFPDWAARLDLARAEWLEQEAFLDPPAGEKRVLDAVAKVPARLPVPDPGGRAAGHSLVVGVEVEPPERATGVPPPRMLWFLRGGRAKSPGRFWPRNHSRSWGCPTSGRYNLPHASYGRCHA